MTTPTPSSPLWLIDLDNTIFDASAGMFGAIHEAMDTFISERFNCTREEASERRSAYWRRYGATYEGLWVEDGISPEEFLTATHAFDLTPHLVVEGNPRHDLAKLKGRKVLYTNGPRDYALRVLSHFGLEDEFLDIVTASESFRLGRWRAKPDPLALEAICRTFHVKHSDCVLVDDSLQNLKCAHQLGMKTVWCTGYRHRHGQGGETRVVSWLSGRVRHIRELPRLGLFATPKPAPDRHAARRRAQERAAVNPYGFL